MIVRSFDELREIVTSVPFHPTIRQLEGGDWVIVITTVDDTFVLGDWHYRPHRFKTFDAAFNKMRVLQAESCRSHEHRTSFRVESFAPIKGDARMARWRNR